MAVWGALLLSAAPRGSMSDRPADELFWSSGPVGAVAKAVPPRDGVQLLVPARVDLGERQTLPAVLRRKASMREDLVAPLLRFGVVVALDLEKDEAFAGLAQAPRDNAGAFVEPDAEQLEQAGEGKTTQALQVDLRAALVLPWRPAELLVFGAVRDHRSEPVRVALQGGGPAEPQPARERALEVASRERVHGSPAVPGAPGIAIAVDASQHALHGAYRLAAGSFIHLVFCGRKHPRPTVVRLRAEGPEGHFNVALPAVKLGAPQAYTVWAVARDAISAPAEAPSGSTRP
jgi:hypothetical protein